MSSLTTFADMNPVPRVLVDVPVAEFPAGAVTVSLMRSAGGRTFNVRGGQRLPASSPAVVLDVEAPFGVESAYTVFGFDAAGNIVGSFPVGVATLEFDGCVVQQPLDARLSVVVDRRAGHGYSRSRPSPGAVVQPQGQVLPGVVGLGPRSGLRGVQLELLAFSHADADMLQATLGTYESPQLPVWLIRTPPDHRLPSVFFCHVPDLVELDKFYDSGNGYVVFSATVTEVRPPAEGISGAVLTYSDIGVFYGTYSALGAAYATYSDIKRDTSLIGAADA